jgi:hypothetical protein
MTVNERIHEMSFAYDEAVAPSVPAGMPLRTSRADRTGSRLRWGLRLGRRRGARRRA